MIHWAMWYHGVCVGLIVGWIIGAFTAIVCLRPRKPAAVPQESTGV